MAKLKVMCARSMHLIVGELGAAFGKAAGHDIEFDFGTVGGLEAKIAAGETADVYILSVAGIGKMLAEIPLESLCFGSHAPYFYFEATLLKLRESVLTPEQEAAIRHGHAAALLT